MKMIFKPLTDSISAAHGPSYMKNSLILADDIYTWLGWCIKELTVKGE